VRWGSIARSSRPKPGGGSSFCLARSGRCCPCCATGRDWRRFLRLVGRGGLRIP